MTEPSERPAASLAKAPNPHWQTWALAVVGALWVAKILGARLPFLPLTAVLAVVVLLNAVRFAPRRGNPARRRAPLLLLLAAPGLAAVAFGPLGMLPATPDPAHRSLLLAIQHGALAASAALPLILLYPMRGARIFTLIVGAMAFAVCFAIDVLSEFRITPS